MTRVACGIIFTLFLCGCNQDRLARLEQENKELRAELEKQKQAVNLDLQAKCATQARSVFREQGWDKEQLASYTNHYHRKLNKCFIEISNTAMHNNVPSANIALQDAFEGRPYGEYAWVNPQQKKYWEVKPFMCKVTLLSGEEKICVSQDEFEKLIRPYMEQ